MVDWKKVGLCAWAFLVLVAIMAIVKLFQIGEYLLAVGVLAAVLADIPAAKKMLDILAGIDE